MANLTAAGRAGLVAHTRLFLERVSPVHSPERHTIYHYHITPLIGSLTTTFCSSARANAQTYILNIQTLSNAQGGLASDVAVVENFALAPSHATSIAKTLKKKRGISVVHLEFKMVDTGGSHCCLLVFNARRGTQHFFNPWGYQNHWLNIAFHNRRGNRLVEGFDHASPFVDAWPDYDKSMQGRLDNNHYNSPGNCALCSMLVAVLCMRFGVGYPKVMADIIMEAVAAIDQSHGFNVDQHNPASSHISRLWNWMNDLIDIANTMNLDALDANSVNTMDMCTARNEDRAKAQDFLDNFPPLHPPYRVSLIERRARHIQRQLAWLNSHPPLFLGAPIGLEAILERAQVKAEAEVKILTLAFPPSLQCGVVLRSGKLCRRRSCVGQPLCWQHRYYTRNHRRTGVGRMRCAASQRACT